MTTSEKEVGVSESVYCSNFLPAGSRKAEEEENNQRSRWSFTRLGNVQTRVRNEMLPHPAATSQLLI